MKILVSNDDGYLARGIKVLAEAMSEIADVIVMAPDRNHSGASNSLTLHSPLRVHKVDDDRYFVIGTPSDCVHLALSGYLDDDPDLVVSGVNHGANLGDDVLSERTESPVFFRAVAQCVSRNIASATQPTNSATRARWGPLACST